MIVYKNYTVKYWFYCSKAMLLLFTLQILNLTSKCACPDGCLSVPETTSNGGLSTGSKLLIA